jgi:Tol biopolymer transport system component
MSGGYGSDFKFKIFNFKDLSETVDKRSTLYYNGHMKKKTFSYFFLVLLFTCVVLFPDAQDSFRDLQGPYLGQKAPVKKAGVFLDGLVSTLESPEMNSAFTQDGKEFYYCAHYQGRWAIFFTKEAGGHWTQPKPMTFTSICVDRDFTMSPDGNKIYFGSNRPAQKGEPLKKRLNIFVTERLSNGQWSQPKAIGPPINTAYGENYPSVAENGNLYFFSCREDGLGGCDIYLAKFINGSYSTPVNLGSAVNSGKDDWDAYISADESYIIFSSLDRPDSVGGQDLYISFKKKDGGWTRAKNMGSAVNSPYGEICPVVSLDGEYFLFTSRRRGKADIFWMTTDVIKKLEAKETAAL